MAAVLAWAGAAAVAQTPHDAMQLPPIPVDDAVRTGRLDNGLTYYIRHNEYPANVANFYIAQRVGSINEDDDQRGLAHFLEHMAFNGSEHFAGNGIIDYTRTLGVQFGRNLNAYTSTDETVYNINDVPMTRLSSLDSCLLILKDWSDGLLLEADEIDKERGVIHEEWRLRSSAGQRMFETILPTVYPGSKYGQRMPIGLMEIVDNFEPQALRDYYHKWYRPDNQAIVVVGAVDPDYVEQKIKELFSATTVPADAAQVVDEPVPDNEEAIFVTATDKEMPYSQLMVMVKSDPTPADIKATLPYLAEVYMRAVIGSMMSSRLSEMMQEADCPFMYAEADYEKYLMSKTKNAFSLVGIAKDGLDSKTLQTLYTELRRALCYGFTATEYERAKADRLSELEKSYTNRDKTENDVYAKKYCRHYLDGEPIPSIETEYRMVTMIASQLPVDMVNEYMRQTVSDTDTNLVVICFAPQNEGATVISPEEMRQAVDEARKEELTPYIDNVRDEPLVGDLPAKGSIVGETWNETLGYKELTLSNGAKVILKPTDFKDDEVKMKAFAPGGMNNYGSDDYCCLKVLEDAVEHSGRGAFSYTELAKALAGKKASVKADFGYTQTELNGTSTPNDLETMMQLTYLCLTDVSRDDAAFANEMNSQRLTVRHKGLMPEGAFSDSIIVTTKDHHPLYNPLTEDDIDSADYGRILEIARELLSCPDAFTFVFTGNFDEATLRDMLCTYIASLPAGTTERQATDINAQAHGIVVNSFTRRMETPKALAFDLWHCDTPYTLENKILADAVGQVLSMYYLRTIREDAGAAYTVMAQGQAVRVLDNQKAQLQVYCPMDPEKAELAISLLHKGMADAAESIDAQDLQKVKEYMLKQADEDARKNGWWLNVIKEYLQYGIDLQTDYKTVVSSLTPERVSAFIKDTLLKDGNRVEIIMMPE